MTNEEIERRAAMLAVDLGQELDLPVGANLRPLREALERVACEALAAAYEEAAQIAGANFDDDPQRYNMERMAMSAGEDIAERLRALKDSLVQESVAST